MVKWAAVVLLTTDRIFRKLTKNAYKWAFFDYGEEGSLLWYKY